jgi:hypothetical protein
MWQEGGSTPPAQTRGVIISAREPEQTRPTRAAPSVIQARVAMVEVVVIRVIIIIVPSAAIVASVIGGRRGGVNSMIWRLTG